MSSIHYSHCPEQDIWTAPAQLVQQDRLPNWAGGTGHGGGSSDRRPQLWAPDAALGGAILRSPGELAGDPAAQVLIGETGQKRLVIQKKEKDGKISSFQFGGSPFHGECRDLTPTLGDLQTWVICKPGSCEGSVFYWVQTNCQMLCPLTL